MVFHFASILESGQVVEQETFDPATFDRSVVEHFADLIKQGEDFGEDLQQAHLEFTKTGPTSAVVEISSDTDDVVIHLLGNTDPNSSKKELRDLLVTVQDPAKPSGEILRITARPLALALLPGATPEARALARYPIGLAAAFFERIAAR